MKPTIEILANISKNSKKNKDEIFTRLYRYMLRPDIYYVAYENLYTNSGASTNGIDNDTADGFSEEKVNKIIEMLSNETYSPKAVRREYIEKKNSNKKRPLGIPTFTDKLVGEVLRMILEAVYEPTFSDNSHGFRPQRSCHTALKTIKNEFTGSKWFIEGDIKGCFDNIDHQVLVKVINEKIKDAKLIKLVWKFLKAGYMENSKHYPTYSGCPQGGVVSPIFANIYLNELDKFAQKLADEFYKKADRVRTKEYDDNMGKITKISKQLQSAKGQEKTELLKLKKELKKLQKQLPCKSQTDKVMKYIRYADDFIIAIKGNRIDCEEIKKQLSKFINETLKMELSEEKTLITHSNNYARFLGYDIRVRRDNTVKRQGNHLQRTLNGKVELNIPFTDKIMPFLFSKSIIKQNPNGEIEPIARKQLYRCTDFEILSSFNSELRGMCNYYALASNFNRLTYFAYLMEYSCLKTIAGKHKTTTRKIISKYNRNIKSQKWAIPYETKKGITYRGFANFMDCKKTKSCDDILINHAFIHANTRTIFEDRLKAKECELCGKTNVALEIHHVNKVKNLKGKEFWEIVMIAKQRKTIAVCKSCHVKIHNPKSLKKN